MLQKCYKGQIRTGTRARARGRALSLGSSGQASWASCELDELRSSTSRPREDELESYEEEEDAGMFYVVDQWDQYIREFPDRFSADQFCEKWNARFRFSEWGAPKAHVIEGD